MTKPGSTSSQRSERCRGLPFQAFSKLLPEKSGLSLEKRDSIEIGVEYRPRLWSDRFWREEMSPCQSEVKVDTDSVSKTCSNLSSRGVK